METGNINANGFVDGIGLDFAAQVLLLISVLCVCECLRRRSIFCLFESLWRSNTQPYNRMIFHLHFNSVEKCFKQTQFIEEWETKCMQLPLPIHLIQLRFGLIAPNGLSEWQVCRYFVWVCGRKSQQKPIEKRIELWINICNYSLDSNYIAHPTCFKRLRVETKWRRIRCRNGDISFTQRQIVTNPKSSVMQQRNARNRKIQSAMCKQ